MTGPSLRQSTGADGRGRAPVVPTDALSDQQPAFSDQLHAALATAGRDAEAAAMAGVFAIEATVDSLHARNRLALSILQHASPCGEDTETVRRAIAALNGASIDQIAEGGAA